MRRIFLHTTIMFLIVAIAIIIFPVEKRLKYQNLEKDCFNHALWIHDRIFLNEAPVDIAFFGSSHTVNGINDNQITNQLDNGSIAANLGYCRLGRNLHYTLLKDLLKNKKPKHIILEVRGDEDWFSHPVFPNLADNRDLYLPKLLFNKDLFPDLYNGFSYKLQITQETLFKDTEEAPPRKNNYGYATSADTADRKFLLQKKEERAYSKREMSELERNFQLKYPRSYLKEISEICTENNITLSFVYLPNFGNPYSVPLEADLYTELGNLFYPPDSIMDDPDNWYDAEHLNQAGADKLAVWLADQLAKN